MHNGWNIYSRLVYMTGYKKRNQIFWNTCSQESQKK